MVKSPCINVCKMEKDVCAGCFRTIDEIASWSAIGDEDKRKIVAAAEQRRIRCGSGAGPIFQTGDT